MKPNNKKRQSAVFSNRYVNIYLRYIRGQKIRNGSLTKGLFNEPIMLPITIQEMINKSWENWHKQIIKQMPIIITINERGTSYESNISKGDHQIKL